MSLEDDFNDAQNRIRQLTNPPPNDDLRGLYGLYKQATVGDADGARPGLLDPIGRAKYDAWASRKGMTREDAMKQYVELADVVLKMYG